MFHILTFKQNLTAAVGIWPRPVVFIGSSLSFRVKPLSSDVLAAADAVINRAKRPTGLSPESLLLIFMMAHKFFQAKKKYNLSHQKYCLMLIVYFCKNFVDATIKEKTKKNPL